MTKINQILLVDDDLATNYLHKEILNEVRIAHKVSVVRNGQEALDFLVEEDEGKPNIIFLDINMPLMDGFEFLEYYNALPIRIKEGIVIVLLSTSTWDKDRKRLESYDFVYDFWEKPLKEEKLLNLKDDYIRTYKKLATV